MNEAEVGKLAEAKKALGELAAMLEKRKKTASELDADTIQFTADWVQSVIESIEEMEGE